MSPRMQNQIAKSKEQALAAFVSNEDRFGHAAAAAAASAPERRTWPRCQLSLRPKRFDIEAAMDAPARPSARSASAIRRS
jgi:hypothetical protein